jgi:3-dehydroquinate dehydratase/shikimate dehydrogenase
MIQHIKIFNKLIDITRRDAAHAAPGPQVDVVASIDLERDRIADVPDAVGWLRLTGRAGPSPACARGRLPGRLIYACSGIEGAAGLDRLREAAAYCELVELDADRDLTPERLDAVPPRRRLISWRGDANNARELAERFRSLAAVGARYYRLVVAGARARDGLAALVFLRDSGRSDTLAYADGEAGLWSRVLAPHLGAPLVFGMLEADSSCPDEPTVRRLIDDFALPDAPSAARVCGIVGGSVARSLSPRLHNAAYRALGLPMLYLPFSVPSFEGFWEDLVEGDPLGRIGLPLRGLTVASPHKIGAAARASRRRPIADQAGAANLLYRRHRGWVADSSDPPGVLHALGRRGLSCRGRQAAVVGCGGSGRAIAAALRQAGADVLLTNRGRERGEWAMARMGLPYVPLAEFSAQGFDLIVNATPVGLCGDGPPFEVGRMSRDAAVVDLVYADAPTPLVAAAAGRGATVVDGREVLLLQVARQFARMTGRALPEPLAARMLGLPEPASGHLAIPGRADRRATP